MRWLPALALALLIASPLAGLCDTAPLRVGLAGEPPFLMKQGQGDWDGACVDIWEKIAAARSWRYEYSYFPNVTEAIQAVKSGQIDILVADAGITKARLAEVEFTQPFLRSGLQIMIAEPRPHSIKRLALDLFSLAALPVFWSVVAAVAVLTVAVFFFEKTHNPDFPKARGEGAVEAFYYVISLALTGKSTYKGFPGILGRLVMVFWMILGVITVAYVTSTITSAMTVEKLKARISGPQDLPGRTVGALAGGSAEEYLTKNGITTIGFPDLPSAVDAMLDHRVDAVVAAFPLLQSFDFSHPRLPITEIGPVFDPQNFGFALPPSSPLRVPINESLLDLSESGDLADIFRRYLGPIYQP